MAATEQEKEDAGADDGDEKGAEAAEPAGEEGEHGLRVNRAAGRECAYAIAGG